ncbi:MAG: hypothetical protein M1837_006467 [Sclerophora amabilis]|nr:MAG: hypothetical protein M1837_006467 [Sclerophora amabilis]
MVNDDIEPSTERTRLLPHILNDRGPGQHFREPDAASILSSHVSKEEQALAATPVGERLPYNGYTTIDWLHDLVKDSFRHRAIHQRRGIRYRILAAFDACQGWIAAALIGILTAGVAFLVDISVATVSDWKLGYCSSAWFRSKETCCTSRSPLSVQADLADTCDQWTSWTTHYWGAFGIYVGFALAFGVLSSSLTMLTKSTLPVATVKQRDYQTGSKEIQQDVAGKSMFMAAGSGIPEIKTILSGFVIPGFLDFKVLVVKAAGAVFAVSSGMCLGKEGPFVHISTCVGWLVGNLFSKYRENGRKMRELLSAACSSGLSVAFGAPIGGVLFSYEEISTYFPRPVLWRAFLCSLCAAVTLRALNPTGTGKLVLYETNYGTSYSPIHYLVFILLGVAGGLFGGTFCKANYLWSKDFRKYPIIKNHPVVEVFLVVLVTGLLQYPNPLTRPSGDLIIKQLLVDCKNPGDSWICQKESAEHSWGYTGWLAYGVVVKLLLTIISFGCKVPSGIIIPALDAGSLFGRLIGQWITTISPGIFAMVGAASFLAGELEYIVPNMIAILVAKWVADALEKESVYDLAQAVLQHPFLDLDQSIRLTKQENALAEVLIPPEQTMREITVHLTHGRAQREILEEKLGQLKRRGLLDAGLVLVQDGHLRGYLSEGEIEFGLRELKLEDEVELLGEAGLSMFVDQAPLTVFEHAPMEYVVEMFGKLGLRYLCVIEEGTSRLVGVIIKKRLVMWLEGLK